MTATNRLIYLWQTLGIFLCLYTPVYRCWCRCRCESVRVCEFWFFSYPCVGACATYVQQIVKTLRF